MKPITSSEINVAEFPERRKRRQRYFVFMMVFLAAYAATITSAWVVFRSPIFRIQSVAVVGNERVDTDQILSLLYGKVIDGKFSKSVFGLKNLLVWPNELSESDLLLLPTLKSLTVEKSFRTRSVVVRVEEREPYGIWCYHRTRDSGGAEIVGSADGQASVPKECWWFDKDGVIFKKSLSAEGSLITTINDYSQQGGGLSSKILPADFEANMFSVLEVVRASGLAIREIRLNDLVLQEVEADTYAGPKLYFSLRLPSTNFSQVLQSFISKPDFAKMKYLDFRVENRAYYK